MKHVWTSLIILAVLLIGLSGCDQYAARQLGGNTTIQLAPGEKLEMVTWKDDASLWLQTRPRRPNEPIEQHVFKESSMLGLMQGTVTIEER